MNEETNPQGFTAEEAAAYEAMKSDAPLEVEATPEDDTAPEVEVSEPAPLAREPAEAKEEPADTGKPPPGFVPHGAMHQERERARQAESELAQVRAEMAALRLAQQYNQPQQQEETPPDIFAEPEKYNEWVQRQTGNAQEQVRRLQEQLQQQAEAQHLAAMLEGDATSFAAEKPDYSQAVSHLVKTRTAELQLIYPNAKPAEVSQAIEQERLNLVRQASSMGMRPAEFMYNLAASRGYTPPAAPVNTQAANQIKAQAAAQAATQSLSSAPANAGAGDLTIESLAKMSPGAYAKLKAERPDDVRRVMRGG